MRPNFITCKYRLRWRFDFHGKPSKFGYWSRSGNVLTEGAWRINKEGLARASIEAECISTFQVKTLAECDGHDFVNFEWLPAIPLPHIGFKGVIKLYPAIVGLAIVKSYTRVAVMIDGTLEIRDRTPDELLNKLQAWSK